MLNLFRKSLFLLLLLFFGALTLAQAETKTALLNENVRIGVVAVDVHHLPKKDRVDYQEYTFDITPSTYGQNFPYVIKKKILMNQKYIKDIRASIDIMGKPAIHIQFTAKGRTLFHRISRQHQGKMLAFVDVLGNNIISVPRVNEPISGGQIQITGVMLSEINDLIQRLRRNVAVHTVVDKPFGEKLAHDEMIMYQKSLPTQKSFNLLINNKFVFKNNDFDKIEWRQEKAETIWGETAKGMEDMPVHVISFQPTAEAKARLMKLLELYESQALKLILWKQDKQNNQNNQFINEFQDIEMDEDAFYLFTFSEDTAQKIWQALIQ